MCAELRVVERAHSDSIWSLCWSSTTDQILTGSLDETMNIFSGSTLEKLHAYPNHHLGIVSVSSDASGRFAAVCSMDAHVRIWDLEAEKIVKDLDRGVTECWSGALNRSGTHIAVGTEPGVVKYINIETGATVSLRDPNVKEFVMTVSTSPSNNIVAAGHANGAVTVYDPFSSSSSSSSSSSTTPFITPLFTIPPQTISPIRSIAFTPDSQYLLVGGDSGRIQIVDAKNGTTVGVAIGHSGSVLSVDASSDGTFATGSSDTTVKVWDFSTFKCFHSFTSHSDQVWAVAFSPDGKRLVSGGDDASLRLYSVAS